MISYRETQQTINEWQDKNFPSATEEGIKEHFIEEVDEFLSACFHGPENNASEEAADVMILLYDWARKRNIDLHLEVDKKMAKNRAREWNIQLDGTGRHK